VSPTATEEEPMGFYREQVLPRGLNIVMDRKPNREIRARVCRGLAGHVVEIGFGTGLNTPYYPAAVKKVVAVEPSEVGIRLARDRIAATPVTVELGGLNGEHLDLPSDTFDAALSTWTLCSIPDFGLALEELRRVLKPGGAFHFVEHGHAPDAKVARWQERIEPFWLPIGGGCHITRRIPEAIEGAGFAIDDLDTYYLKGEPKTFGYMFEGRATKR
jgi:ubiquinone/menaquinone biosynthesis C-methylase UbiE